MTKLALTLSAAAALFALAACDEKPAPAPTTKPAGTSTAAPKPAASDIPATLFLTAAPADAKDIKDAKPTLKAGDKVTLTGRIGGSEEPFVDGRAVFTIVDSHIKDCDQMGEKGHCKTPWDYCCEPSDDLAKASATVQVVGADGKPLKSSLKDVHGLKPLATVVVVGTVASVEGGSLVVNASGMHLKN